MRISISVGDLVEVSVVTDEERKGWTRRVTIMPIHQALALITQHLLTTGEAGLLSFASPESASEWEFNLRVATLQAAFEFERARLTCWSPALPV
jgi:hypothetical protein